MFKGKSMMDWLRNEAWGIFKDVFLVDIALRDAVEQRRPVRPLYSNVAP